MVEEKIKEILAKEVKDGKWSLDIANEGKSKVTYIGKLGTNKVFIKNENSSDALLRLSEIGIAPKIIYSQEDGKKGIFIQEFVEGKHPSKQFINKNYKKFAELFKIFHLDSKLAKILTKENDTYDGVVDSTIDWMVEWGDAIEVLTQKEKDYVTELIKNKPKNVTDLLTPIHADPNNSNFMVASKNIFIIDWDDICLSDPLRDVGQFCYEYVEKENWKDFCSVIGIDLNKDRLKRMYWWISIMKLLVAYWFYLYPKEVKTYEKLAKESIDIFNLEYKRINVNI
jgi:thiamine kinase-like enzyme